VASRALKCEQKSIFTRGLCLIAALREIAVQVRVGDGVVPDPSCYGDLSEAVDLFLELLFFENSRPLHQHLLTTCIRLPELPLQPLPLLKPLPPAASDGASHPPPSSNLRGPVQESRRFSWLASRITRLCQEYSESGPKARRFSLVGVTSSLIGAQFQPLLEPVTRLPALLLAWELCGYIIFMTQHLILAKMDECQEALSALFFLQREYGDQMLGAGANHAFLTGSNRKGAQEGEGEDTRVVGKLGFELVTEDLDTEKQGGAEEGFQVYRSIVTACLGVLQSGSLTRECDVAASVSLCAAILLGSNGADLALQLAQTFFSEENGCVSYSMEDPAGCTAMSSSGALGSEPAQASHQAPRLELVPRTSSSLPINVLVLNPMGTDLRSEFHKCKDFGRLCVLRSLLTTVPRPNLNQPLLRKAPGTPAKPWTLLYDGILPTLCSLCEDATDAHFKFHAITCLQVCLQQVKASFEDDVAECRRRGSEQGLEQGLKPGLEPGSEQSLGRGLGQGLGQGLEQGLEQGLGPGQGVDSAYEEAREGSSNLSGAEDGGEAAKEFLGSLDGSVSARASGVQESPVNNTQGRSTGKTPVGRSALDLGDGASGFALEGSGKRGVEDERRQGGECGLGSGARVLRKETLDRVLQIVWNNWEDPLSQTVKQTQVRKAAWWVLASLKTGRLSCCERSKGAPCVVRWWHL
jgi:hypothetical protein